MSPCSTFKICLSLIGFELGILQDPQHPLWPYKKEYEEQLDYFRDSWRAPQNPTSWIQTSCIWYSQLLAQQIGWQTLQESVQALNYGNQDFTGGLYAWLESSLRISPKEQLEFLKRLLHNALPLSSSTLLLTQELLFIETLPNGMLLYGKTGSGTHAQGQENPLPIGWFVGWALQGTRRLAFVYRIHGTDSDNQIPSLTAKERAKERLLELFP